LLGDLPTLAAFGASAASAAHDSASVAAIAQRRTQFPFMNVPP
jgi:hypothetical protein